MTNTMTKNDKQNDNKTEMTKKMTTKTTKKWQNKYFDFFNLCLPKFLLSLCNVQTAPPLRTIKTIPVWCQGGVQPPKKYYKMTRATLSKNTRCPLK
jgi:hypothetical protein